MQGVEAVRRGKHLGCGLEDEVRVTERRQRHPPDPVRVLLGQRTRCLRCQSRLACAPRPGQREQPNVLAREQG